MSLQWWAYVHRNGTYHVKRYFDQRDIEDARRSPFVEGVVGPFEDTPDVHERIKEALAQP